MRNLNLWQIELLPWYVFVMVWLVTGFRVKPAKIEEPLSKRVVHGILFTIGFYLLFAKYQHYGVLDSRLVPQLYSLQLVAIGLTSAGVALAVWARVVLGENWSARVTRKVGHELIRTGPYGYVRHPIYSGLLLATAGTALFVGELKGLLALSLVLMAESFKAKREETIHAGRVRRDLRTVPARNRLPRPKTLNFQRLRGQAPAARAKMGIYSKYILPHLIDLVMRNREQTRLRREWVPRAQGNVLEVGIGSGLNLAFYSGTVQQLFGLDCSEELLAKAHKRAANLPFKLTFVEQSVEETISVANASMDTVVMTWVLCSIADPARALREVRRVLKPEGQFIFLEHGLAPEPSVARWQDRLTPTWRHIAGGCTLNRKMDELIISAGFRITELGQEYLAGPRPMTYMYKGVAVPS